MGTRIVVGDGRFVGTTVGAAVGKRPNVGNGPVVGGGLVGALVGVAFGAAVGVGPLAKKQSQENTQAGALESMNFTHLERLPQQFPPFTPPSQKN